jgi:U2 small nuclear ribonucleoprotein B''
MRFLDGHDAGAAATIAPRRQEMQMPDEYLPPNKILFLHNVPERISRDQLDTLFRSHQGLVDVRTIPGRNVAFVEFTDSVTSAIAKDALHGHTFSETETLRITFAK